VPSIDLNTIDIVLVSSRKAICGAYRSIQSKSHMALPYRYLVEVGCEGRLL
jgi:hypothetical protein